MHLATYPLYDRELTLSRTEEFFMKRSKLTILFSIAAMLFAAVGIDAQPTRATDTQLRNLVNQINTKKSSFRQTVTKSTGRNSQLNTQTRSSIISSLNELDRTTNAYRTSLNARRATSNQVTAILSPAQQIDEIMMSGNYSGTLQTRWSALRSDLEILAGHYSLSFNPRGRPGGGPGGRFPSNSLDQQLTGTYRLNQSLSDNVQTVLNNSMSSVNANDRGRQRQNLEARLTAPQQLALEKSGQTFTIASNLAQPITVQVDGRTHTEPGPRGTTIRTTASATRDSVTINTDGDRANDFGLTFNVDGNNRLRVTRTLYLENQNRTISSTSVYDKTQNVAQWPTVNVPNRPIAGGNRSGGNNNTNFIIPNGTQINAVLRGRITSRDSQPGDRFTLEVVSPDRYRGAIIEGRVGDAESSGRVSGRANVSLEFDTIRYNNRTYNFAGIIESARTAGGDNISINTEGEVRDGSQTTRTVTRAGVGAALGALIGAIAGGGQGAAIGAGIGAGAGAGTVLIQGRDNLELEQGTQFTITSTGPQNY